MNSSCATVRLNLKLPSLIARLTFFYLSRIALVPQLRNIYRHGELHNCSWKFQDFKYCMSLKSEDPEGKRELWVKRRAEWWARRRVGVSSEDVWDVRTWVAFLSPHTQKFSHPFSSRRYITFICEWSSWLFGNFCRNREKLENFPPLGEEVTSETSTT